MNRGTWGGIAIALLGIASGLYLEHGKLGQILQPTAALIVFGGTLGAVLVQFPLPVVLEAAQHLKSVFSKVEDPAEELIEDLTRLALRARRNGILSLDAELEAINDPFLKKALMFAIDGVQIDDLKRTMELEMDLEADKDDLIPKVFESAGGFAPTIGILGAVIGLIQVVQRMQNIDEVGKGIAVAFVATIYGVGSANILLLPCAGRIRMMMRRKQVLRELILEGVISIVERTNPRAMEAKLSVYMESPAGSKRQNAVTA